MEKAYLVDDKVFLNIENLEQYTRNRNNCDVKVVPIIDANENKLLDELYKLVEPRLLGDFCGYDESTQSFNIILALKEILENLEGKNG